MPLTARQKAWPHIYADAAGLSPAAYRQTLRTHTGCATCASPKLTQDAYDRLMAALETILWARVDQGHVHDPRACPDCGAELQRVPRSAPARYLCPVGCTSRPIPSPIRSRTYWRDRAPAEGMCNSRQRHALEQHWTLLLPTLPEEARSHTYLAGIIRSATNQRLPDILHADRLQWDRIPRHAANLALEALKDRLRHAHA